MKILRTCLRDNETNKAYASILLSTFYEILGFESIIAVEVEDSQSTTSMEILHFGRGQNLFEVLDRDLCETVRQ